jgi:hypothetical protein
MTNKKSVQNGIFMHFAAGCVTVIMKSPSTAMRAVLSTEEARGIRDAAERAPDDHATS